MAIAIGGANLIEGTKIDTISGYLEVGVPIALVIMMLLEWFRGVRQDEM